MTEKRIKAWRGVAPLLAALALSACPGPNTNTTAEISNGTTAADAMPSQSASNAAVPTRAIVSEADLSAHTPRPIGDWADDAAALAAWKAAKLPAGTYGFGSVAGIPVAITDGGEIKRIEMGPPVGSGPPERPPTKPGSY